MLFRSAYIDDASSRVYARFYTHEGTIPAMDSFQHYVQQYGIPLAIYADKHTTYQSPASPSVEEQLAGVMPMSQFGRALGELGVELIPAHSPQAKGRVERRFNTFHDRVIKERRLADVSTLDAANQCLKGSLPIYNRRFAVQPAQAADLHRPKLAGGDLNRILCIKTTRCLRRDGAVAHHGHLYQVRTTVRAAHVMGEERVDGTMWMTHKGRPLTYQAIVARPLRVPPSPRIVRPQRPVTPTRAHPWRKRLLPEGTRHAAAGIT